MTKTASGHPWSTAIVLIVFSSTDTPLSRIASLWKLREEAVCEIERVGRDEYYGRNDFEGTLDESGSILFRPAQGCLTSLP